ncbi:hypothetical protein HYH02_014905 [Chlamydomonas schloesseri]|uniref:Uncharacterized protein n=1 Tax=Chlamydomonas schloesseri TaxID=2026947 RepID=A0A835VS94_9CHLO|nr:hypothetical protein HYH02_014905 [Chlamydomonas schloesseri]|eukprot:KAG2425905.1 hypothetical protein HYH02_014905 [Chlamydomonas schloesseri]
MKAAAMLLGPDGCCKAASEQPRGAQPSQEDQPRRRCGCVGGEAQPGSAHEAQPRAPLPPEAGGQQQQQRPQQRAQPRQQGEQPGPARAAPQPHSSPRATPAPSPPPARAASEQPRGAQPSQEGRPRKRHRCEEGEAQPPPKKPQQRAQQRQRGEQPGPARAAPQPHSSPRATPAPSPQRARAASEQPRGAQPIQEGQPRTRRRRVGGEERPGSAHEAQQQQQQQQQQRQQRRQQQEAQGRSPAAQEPGAEHPQQAHAADPSMPRQERPQRMAAQKLAQESAQKAAQRKELEKRQKALEAALQALAAADTQYKAAWVELQYARGLEPAEQQASEAVTEAREGYEAAYQAMCLARHAVRVQRAVLGRKSPPIFEAEPAPEPYWTSTECVNLLNNDDE